MRRGLRAIGRVCLVLLACEAAARIAFDRINPRHFGDFEASSVWWRLRWAHGVKHPLQGDVVPSHLVYDPSRGWVTKADLRSVQVGLHGTASTNSRGIRGLREYPYARRPGFRRILVIGDSFAFGENVNDDQTFESIIEKARPGLEVINMGVSGYSHEQMLLALREEGLRYHPDVVLLPFINGDATRNRLTFRTYAKPYLDPSAGCVPSGRPVPPPGAVMSAFERHSRLLDLLELLRDRFWPSRWRNDCTDGVLDELVRTARTGGARFVAVYPDLWPNLDPPIDLFNNFCGRNRICCAVFRPRKASPDLEAADEKADRLYDHWRPQRHRELAGFLLRFLGSGAHCD